jgi:hypothetical protein
MVQMEIREEPLRELIVGAFCEVCQKSCLAVATCLGKGRVFL